MPESQKNVRPTDEVHSVGLGINRRRFMQGVAAAGGAAVAGRVGSARAQTDPSGVASPEAPFLAEGDPKFVLRAPEPDPQRGGMLRVAFNGATANFDLYQGGSFPVLSHIYNGLVRENLADGLHTIVPDLATAWAVSDDGLTHTFNLREGVTFHDGTSFTADDVVATFERIISPPEGTAILVRDRFPALSGVESVNQLTVRFTLTEPQATFIPILADPGMVIYSRAALEENNYDLRRVVAPGTGPFIFEDYIEGEQWLFSRNDAYWNEADLPYIDRLQILHIPAWPDRGTAVLTDQADLSWNVGKETFEEGASRPDIETHPVAATGAYVLVINTAVEPFDDPRVRRALHLVLDRSALIQVFASQEQMNLSRWVPRGDQYATPMEEIATLPGYRPEKDEDIAEAQRLLAEAGYPDGISDVDFLAASVAGHSELLAPAIQDQLRRALNIETDIRTQERSLLVEDQRAGNYTLVLTTIGSPISDFSPLANQTFKTGGSSNFNGFSSERFDELLEQSDQELDEEARAEMIQEMEQLLDQESPILMLGYTNQRMMWNVRVKGLALKLREQWENGRVETAWIDHS